MLSWFPNLSHSKSPPFQSMLDLIVRLILLNLHSDLISLLFKISNSSPLNTKQTQMSLPGIQHFPNYFFPILFPLLPFIHLISQLQQNIASDPLIYCFCDLLMSCASNALPADPSLIQNPWNVLKYYVLNSFSHFPSHSMPLEVSNLSSVFQ